MTDLPAPIEAAEAGVVPSFSEGYVRMRLADAVKFHPRGQKGWATDQGLSPAYVNDVLHGHRRVSQTMATALGFELVVSFVARASSPQTKEGET